MVSSAPSHLEAPTMCEILAASSLAVQMAGCGPALAFVAIAQMLHNRRKAALAHKHTLGSEHPSYGDGSLAGACGSTRKNLSAHSKTLSRAHLRAIASVCRVAAGEEADPTCGATLCHRHDEAPPWSQQAIATALIGDLVFYVSAEQVQR